MQMYYIPKILVISLLIIWLFSIGCSSDQLKLVSIKLAEIESLTKTGQGSFYKPRVLSDTTYVFFTGPGDRGIWKMNVNAGTITQLNGNRGAGTTILQPKAGGPLFFRVDTLGKDRRRRFGIGQQSTEGGKVTMLREPIYRSISNLQIPQNNILVFWSGKKFEAIDLNNGIDLKPERLNIKSYAYQDSTIYTLQNGAIQADWCQSTGLLAWVEQSDDGMHIIKSLIAIGTIDRRITQILAGVQGENPSWTPDGKYLYFNTPEGLIKRVKIYLEYN
jgi:hypothetical protein